MFAENSSRNVQDSSRCKIDIIHWLSCISLHIWSPLIGDEIKFEILIDFYLSPLLFFLVQEPSVHKIPPVASYRSDISQRRRPMGTRVKRGQPRTSRFSGVVSSFPFVLYASCESDSVRILRWRRVAFSANDAPKTGYHSTRKDSIPDIFECSSMWFYEKM